jgi:hypothetical protein
VCIISLQDKLLINIKFTAWEPLHERWQSTIF